MIFSKKKENSSSKKTNDNSKKAKSGPKCPYPKEQSKRDLLKTRIRNLAGVALLIFWVEGAQFRVLEIPSRPK